MRFDRPAWSGSVLGVCVALWSGAALAQEPAPTGEAPDPAASASKLDFHPSEVLSRPSDAQVKAAFPERALKAGVSGSVELSCVIGLSERLENCEVRNETPPGYGYGAAALGLARNYRVRPPRLGDRPLENSGFRIPFRFKVLPPPAVSQARARVRAAPIADGAVLTLPAPPPPAPPRPFVRSPDVLWAPLSFATAVLIALVASLVTRVSPRPRRRKQWA